MKADQVGPFRGSKSRNKVSVGEPAEGSLMSAYAVLVYIIVTEFDHISSTDELKMVLIYCLLVRFDYYRAYQVLNNFIVIFFDFIPHTN